MSWAPPSTEGRQPDVKQQRTTGGSAFYRVYGQVGRPSARAGWPRDEVRKNLLGALGRPELARFVNCRARISSR